MDDRYDVWLNAFASNSAEPAPAALVRVFGITEEAAHAILASLPRVVRSGVPVLMAQRVMGALESIGGRAEMVPCARVEGRVANQLSSAETLKLGTQDLAAFGLDASFLTGARELPGAQGVSPPAYAWPVEVAAIASSFPATPVGGATPQSLPAQASSASFAITHDVQAWITPPQPSSAAPNSSVPQSSGSPITSSPPVALELGPLPAANPVSARLALPLDGLTRSPRRMRSPSERAQPVRRTRRMAAPHTAPNASVLDPIGLLLRIGKDARERSIRAALAGHPTAGFLLVLGSTSFAFWLVYIVGK